jgi:hypothetical protein
MPYGGQCVLVEVVDTFESCELDIDCEFGYRCVEVTWDPDPRLRFRRCVWFWEAYNR